MKKYQIEALQIAKKSILEKYWEFDLSNYVPKSQELYEIKSCFVTLTTLSNNLRWCIIGNLTPSRELYLDIIDNAKKSAFNDSRFNAVWYEELKNLYMEITILSPMKLLIFDSIWNFYLYLENNKPWLYIELYWYSATYLPLVWKQIKDPKDFVSHLLMKAWINFTDFLDNFSKTKIKVYTWEEFWDYFVNI